MPRTQPRIMDQPSASLDERSGEFCYRERRFFRQETDHLSGNTSFIRTRRRGLLDAAGARRSTSYLRDHTDDWLALFPVLRRQADSGPGAEKPSLLQQGTCSAVWLLAERKTVGPDGT